MIEKFLEIYAQWPPINQLIFALVVAVGGGVWLYLVMPGCGHAAERTARWVTFMLRGWPGNRRRSLGQAGATTPCVPTLTTPVDASTPPRPGKQPPPGVVDINALINVIMAQQRSPAGEMKKEEQPPQRRLRAEPASPEQADKAMLDALAAYRRDEATPVSNSRNGGDHDDEDSNSQDQGP